MTLYDQILGLFCFVAWPWHAVYTTDFCQNHFPTALLVQIETVP